MIEIRNFKKLPVKYLPHLHKLLDIEKNTEFFEGEGSIIVTDKNIITSLLDILGLEDTIDVLEYKGDTLSLYRVVNNCGVLQIDLLNFYNIEEEYVSPEDKTLRIEKSEKARQAA